MVVLLYSDSSKLRSGQDHPSSFHRSGSTQPASSTPIRRADTTVPLCRVADVNTERQHVHAIPALRAWGTCQSDSRLRRHRACFDIGVPVRTSTRMGEVEAVRWCWLARRADGMEMDLRFSWKKRYLSACGGVDALSLDRLACHCEMVCMLQLLTRRHLLLNAVHRTSLATAQSQD